MIESKGDAFRSLAEECKRASEERRRPGTETPELGGRVEWGRAAGRDWLVLPGAPGTL